MIVRNSVRSGSSPLIGVTTSTSKATLKWGIIKRSKLDFSEVDMHPNGAWRSERSCRNGIRIGGREQIAAQNSSTLITISIQKEWSTTTVTVLIEFAEARLYSAKWVTNFKPEKIKQKILGWPPTIVHCELHLGNSCVIIAGLIQVKRKGYFSSCLDLRA